MATNHYTYLMTGAVGNNLWINIVCNSVFLSFYSVFGNKHKKNLIKTIAWLAKPLTFAAPEPLPDWFNFLQEDEIFYL